MERLSFGTPAALAPSHPAMTGARANPARKVKEAVVLIAGKRLAVFSIRESKGGSIWVRAGSAFVNKDGSLNVLLDVLPLDGKLHVREAGEKKDGVSGAARRGAEEAGYEVAAAGAQS